MATDNTHVPQTEDMGNSAAQEFNPEVVQVAQADGAPAGGQGTPGGAPVIPGVPNGEVHVEVPAGQTVVRVQVAPGETIDLPFDGSLAARLGQQGNLAIKVGDQTIILQGYAEANQQEGVTLKNAKGEAIDVASVLAQTDPNLDIQTAAGPAAGPAGAQGGHLFFGFSPNGGLGGLGELGVINPTELQYKLIQPDENLLVVAQAPSYSITFDITNGVVNEDDLHHTHYTHNGDTSGEQVEVFYSSWENPASAGLQDQLNAFFGDYSFKSRTGNDPFDTTDNENGSQNTPPLSDNNGGIDQDREPLTATAHVAVNFHNGPGGTLTFDHNGSVPVITALQAQHLTSHGNELSYQLLPATATHGESIVAYYTDCGQTYVVFALEIQQPSGAAQSTFDVTYTIYGAIDNTGANAVEFDLPTTFFLNATGSSLFTQSNPTDLVFRDIDDVPALGHFDYGCITTGGDVSGEGSSHAYGPVHYDPANLTIGLDETPGAQNAQHGNATTYDANLGVLDPNHSLGQQQTQQTDDVDGFHAWYLESAAKCNIDHILGQSPITDPSNPDFGSDANQLLIYQQSVLGQLSGKYIDGDQFCVRPLGAASVCLDVSFGADGKAQGNNQAGETLFKHDGGANATAFELYMQVGNGAPTESTLLDSQKTNVLVNIDNGHGGSTPEHVYAFQLDANTIIGIAFPDSEGGNGQVPSLTLAQIEQGSCGTPVFEIHLDPQTGELSLIQYHSVDNPAIDGVNGPNDPTQILTDDGQQLIHFRATDYDGDHVDAPLEVAIIDDAPVICRITYCSPGSEDSSKGYVDEDWLSGATNSGNPGNHDHDGTPGDGPGHTHVSGQIQVQNEVDTPLNFSFTVPGLTTAHSVAYDGIKTVDGHGVTLTLTQSGENWVITGSDSDNGHAVFTVTLDSLTGQFSFDLLGALQHNGGQPEAAFEENLNLNFGVQVKDSDGDAAPGTLSFVVNDDAPKVNLCVIENAHTLLDETAGVQNGTDDQYGPVPHIFDGVGNTTPALGWAQSSGAIISSAGTSYGADGAGSTVMKLQTSSDGVDSGLTTDSGQHILLYQQGDLVVGKVEGTGQVALAIALDTTTGKMTTVEYVALHHPDASDPNDIVSINNDALQVSLTVTDGDGDTVNKTVGVGNTVEFRDDAPIAHDDSATLDERLPSWIDPDQNPHVVTGNVVLGNSNDLNPFNNSEPDHESVDHSHTITEMKYGDTTIDLNFGNVGSEVTTNGGTDASNIVYNSATGVLSFDTPYGHLDIVVDSKIADPDPTHFGDYFNNQELGSYQYTGAHNANDTYYGIPLNGDGSSQLPNGGSDAANVAELLNSFGAVGITNNNGDAWSYKEVTVNGKTYAGLGVAGGLDNGETDTKNGGHAEQITLALPNAVNNATVTLGALFDGNLYDSGHLEVAQWQAIGADGHTVVASGVVTGDYDGLVDIHIETGGQTFSSIVLTPLDDGAGANGNNSDFLVVGVNTCQPVNVCEQFNYTLTDSDGDSSSANLNINVIDYQPSIAAHGNTTSVVVDEDGLPGGTNNDVTFPNSDKSPGDVIGGHNSASEASYHGGVFHYDVGADGFGSLTLNCNSNVQTIDGKSVIFAWDEATHQLIGYEDGDTSKVAVEVTLHPLNGTDYSAGFTFDVDLKEPLLDPQNSIEDNLKLDIQVQIEDRDCDVATGTIHVTVNDDMPVIVTTPVVDTTVSSNQNPQGQGVCLSESTQTVTVDTNNAPGWISIVAANDLGQTGAGKASVEVVPNTGFGVDSNTDGGSGGRFDEINYDGNNKSESLTFNFGTHLVESATVELARFYSDENGTNEVGHWAAYKGGVLVAEGDFSADSVSGQFGLAIPTVAGGFDTLTFTAKADHQLHGTDNSDYLVQEMNLNLLPTDQQTGHFTYKFGADGGVLPSGNAGSEAGLGFQAHYTGAALTSDGHAVTVTESVVNGHILIQGTDSVTHLAVFTMDVNPGTPDSNGLSTASYTYTQYGPLDNNPAGSNLPFHFAITDRDGDTVGTDVSVCLKDSTPTAGAVAADVYEKGLDQTGTDHDGTAKGDGSNATTGFLNFAYNGDGPGHITDVHSTNGDSATVTHANGIWTVTSDHYVLTVDDTTGYYTFKLTENYQNSNSSPDSFDNVLGHFGSTSGTDLLTALGFSFTVTDADGSPASGTLNVAVHDDGPTAAAPLSMTVDEDALDAAHGHLGSPGIEGGPGDIGVVGTSSTASLAGINFGADGKGDIKIDTTNLPALTSDGHNVQYSLSGDGHTLTGFIVYNSPENNLSTTVDLFTLVIDPAGLNATFTLLGPIDHPNPGYGSNTDVNIEDSQNLAFNYKVTDADGDHASGTINVTVNDDSPTASCVDTSTIREPVDSQGQQTTAYELDPTNYDGSTGNANVHIAAGFVDGSGTLVTINGDTPSINVNPDSGGVHGDGFGVSSAADGGNGGRFDEVNYLGDGSPANLMKSEAMILSLADSSKVATSATVNLAEFYSNEGGVGNERGAYMLFRDGVPVSGWISFEANNSNGSETLNITGPAGGFDEIRLIGAQGSANPNGDAGSDSSDFSVHDVTFNVVDQPHVVSTSGDLQLAFGADGPGSVFLTGEGPSNLTYHGLAIHNEIDNGILVGKASDGTVVYTLDITHDGNGYHYEFDLAKPIDGVQSGVPLTFNYDVRDNDGDTSGGCITVHIDDNHGVTVDLTGGNTVNEKGLPTGTGELADGNGGNNSDTSEQTSGSIVVNAPDGVSSITIGGHAVSTDGTTHTVFDDAHGSLDAVWNSGTNSIDYTYTLKNSTAEGVNDTSTFDVVVTDPQGDHNPATTLTINIVDDTPKALADDFHSISAGPANTAMSIGNVLTNDQSGADGYASHAVSDVQGATTDASGFVLTNADGTIHVSYNGDVTFTPAAGKNFGNGEDFTFNYTIKDGDGDTSSATAKFTMTGGNLVPHNVNDSVTVTDAANNANVMIIFDRSGSMGDNPNVSGFDHRIDLARAALNDLLAKYGENGDVRVMIVDFATDASNMGHWGTIAEAEAYLNTLSAGGNTSYSDAVAQAASAWDLSGKGTDYSNYVYFLSDGVPTVDGDTSNNNHLTSGQKSDWNNFLEGHNISDVYAVGVGSDISSNDSDLRDVANPDGDSTPTNPPSQVIIASDEGTLANQLTGTVQSTVHGNVLDGSLSGGGANADTPGNAPAHVASFSHPGTGQTFSWDGNPVDAVHQDGGSTSGVTINGTDVTIVTDKGTMVFHFADGTFDYTPKIADANTSDVFHYVTKDVDGDNGNGADLTININHVNHAPITVDDAASTMANQAVTIDVLANDSDADHDSLIVTAVGGATHGTVSIVNNKVVFTPDNGFTGQGSFTYTVSDGKGGTNTGNAVVNVTQPPQISINNQSVTEPKTGTTTVTFTVTLDQAAGAGGVDVNWATADGSAQAGLDYVAAAGMLHFDAGQTTQTINVTVNSDLLVENNETFNVNLSGAVNAQISDSQGTATIHDNHETLSISSTLPDQYTATAHSGGYPYHESNGTNYYDTSNVDQHNRDISHHYIIGGSGDEHLRAGDAGDILIGNGGHDTFSGGKGDDSFVVDHADFFNSSNDTNLIAGNIVDGGSGIDKIEFNFNFDTTKLDNSGGTTTLSHIDVLDMNNGSHETLTLNYDSVNAMADNKQVIVQANTGDTVELKNDVNHSWSSTGVAVGDDGHNYVHYTAGNGGNAVNVFIDEHATVHIS